MPLGSFDMNSRPVLTLVARLLLSATLLVSASCQSSQAKPSTPPPPPQSSKAKISNEFTASAEVTALAPAERKLTLRREDGSEFEVQADASVRNYDQIAVGDVLRVRYQETLAAAKLPAGTSVGTAEGAFAAARAKQGAKPGAGVGLAVRVNVRIESIDREREIVVFSMASGELVARRLQTAEGRAFVTGLAIGDVVQLDFTQSLALGIEKL